MKKGDKVRCIASGDVDVKAGKVYNVIAGDGDYCAQFGDCLEDDEFNFTDDSGDTRYDVFPCSCVNKWEIVE